MDSDATLTIELSPEISDKLARLSDYTRREQGDLGAEAISLYVAHELAIIEAIEVGREDIRQGRAIPHDQVMQRVREIIRAAKAER